MRRVHFLAVALILGMFYPLSLQSYGPNVIKADGIVTWNLPVVIDKEGDELKECPSDPDVDLSTLVEQATGLWSGAPETGLTTTIRTISDGTPVAVDETNFCDYVFDLSACPLGGNLNGPSEVDGYNPVIFDENGEITDLFFGSGAKKTTLGFSGIVLLEESTLQATKGEGVINLYCLEPCPGATCLATFSETDVLAFVMHELGHFFGLNHTQINIGALDQTHRATMNAVFDPDSPEADFTTLERDDEVGMAYLYPQGPDVLSSDFCTVMGTIRDEDSKEFQCANVIVRNTDSGKSLADAISFVSGGDMVGGSPDPGHGQFTIYGLTPGETYQIEVKPIDTTFPLNQPQSGIIPCNGGNGNPSPPTFDEQILPDTVLCQSSGGALVVVAAPQTLTVTEGSTLNLGDVTVLNASENVERPVETPSESGGCSLIRH